MNFITLPKNNKIYTDLRQQVGSIGREFSLSGVRKDLTKPPIWRKINGNNIECYHWIFEYRYNDDRSKGFDIYINERDEFIQKKDIK